MQAETLSPASGALPNDANRVVLRATAAGTGDWVSTVIGQPATGQRWRLLSARVWLDSPVAADHAQHIFLWSEFLKQEGLPNPNQDFYARIRLNPGTTGRFTSSGGYGPPPPGDFHYTAWVAPISLVYGMGIKFDSDAPVGNTASYEALFQLEAPAQATLLFHYSYPQTGAPQTVNLGSPAGGSFWRLECATVSLRVGAGNGPRLARLVRRPDGFVLAELTKFAPAEGRSQNLAATAGYSSEQTGPAAGGRGSQTVWTKPVTIAANQSIELQLLGPPGDKGHYAIAASNFAGDPPT